ncbi:hypothetical protein LZ480_13605 [Solibacillus sp. MA9]|uniref:Uncharacterized protein n=1 Tax=Solibacillus palustris TaxID=2908203 RepID=A0ABS9UEY7_9BACL|nr:hypothetical protein [Solibacillus sp. MA9]MCH7322912.1 hypothetical protein [Solibacillus sp. MA9]
MSDIQHKEHSRTAYISLFTPWFINENKVQLIIDAITHANRIRKIAIAAYNKGVKIRWFEYSILERTGGIKGILEPVNSKEILTIPSYKPTALDYLTLTAANKESLVFISPSDDNMPSVLFSADSDYSFNQSINWEEEMIITTPHHGSEANKNVYDRFQKETGKDIVVRWVRSDCKSKSRPGPSLLNVKGDKFCTFCRNSIHLRKRLLFKSSSGKWKAIATRKCSCK